MKYTLHPACSAWPAMSADALAELAEDIRTNGLREPLTLTPDGLLLDGQNRALACEMAAVEPLTVVYDGDPVLFSLSKNARRRHLDKAALAFVGAELAKLGRGGQEGNKNSTKTNTANAAFDSRDGTQSTVAAELKVSVANLQHAKTINDKGTAEVIGLAKSGKIGLRAAANYVRKTPKKEQTADPAKIKEATKPRVAIAKAEGKDGKSERDTPSRPSDDNVNDIDVTKLQKAREVVRPLVQSGVPISRQVLMETHGISEATIQRAAAAEVGYNEGLQDGIEKAEIDPDILGPTYKAKYVALEKRLTKEFEYRLQDSIAWHMKNVVDPIYKKRLDQADQVMSHKHPFTKVEFLSLLQAVHPDSTDEMRRNAAFIMLREKEHMLRAPEKGKSGFSSGIPENVADLLSRRRMRA